MGLPAPDKVPGHTVKSHLLTSVNVVHFTPLSEEQNKKKAEDKQNQNQQLKFKNLSGHERNLDKENGEKLITVSEQQEDKSKNRGVRWEMKTKQSHVKETKKIKKLQNLKGRELMLVRENL